jgi:hypothetical protein
VRIEEEDDVTEDVETEVADDEEEPGQEGGNTRCVWSPKMFSVKGTRESSSWVGQSASPSLEKKNLAKSPE